MVRNWVQSPENEKNDNTNENDRQTSKHLSKTVEENPNKIESIYIIISLPKISMLPS